MGKSRSLCKFIVVAALLGLAACNAFNSGTSDGAQTGPQPGESLEPPKISANDDGHLVLAKSDLQREFLLQTAIVELDGTTPSFGSKQSRIVYFLQKKKSLYMMRALKGIAATEDIPAEEILTEFEILKEDENNLAFDFNGGMKRLFTFSELYVSDFFSANLPTFVAPVTHAFIKEVRAKGPRVTIRQIAQMELSAWGEETVQSVEVIYTLQPYRPNPAFTMKKNPGFDRIGYFETHPFARKDYGDTETYISKWDITKPIVFHVSDNTPEKFREAVKEGVLYWNKAFGAEIVRAEMAPKGVYAPHPGYNIIQWVHYHKGWGAYADWQIDPRTGEILHAQVYFTTVFPYKAMEKLKRLELLQDPKEEGKEDEKILLPGLRGFQGRPLCFFPPPNNPLEWQKVAQATGESPRKMTQDYVRVVIAHEIGHLLGLRHNFAGSSGSEVTPREASDRYLEYLATSSVDEPALVSSSVMEYPSFQEDVLLGDYIGREETPALPYDAMAIRWGYYGHRPSDDLEKTVFCTDSEIFRAPDCIQNDRPSHPFLGLSDDWNRQFNGLASAIMNIYLAGKTAADERARFGVEAFELDAESTAGMFARGLDRALHALRDKKLPLSVQRRFPAVTDVNEGEAAQLQLEWVNRAIEKGGGIAGNLPWIRSPENFTIRLKSFGNKIRELLTKPDVAIHFSEEEKAYIEKGTRKFFDLLYGKLIAGITKTLAQEGSDGISPPFHPNSEPEKLTLRPPGNSAEKYLPIRAINDLEDTLAAWAGWIITEGSENKPDHDTELRKTATRIVGSSHGPSPKWQAKNRQKIAADLKEKLTLRFGQPFETVDPEKLEGPMKSAWETEADILSLLNDPVFLNRKKGGRELEKNTKNAESF